MTCNLMALSREVQAQRDKALKEFEADLILGKYTLVRNNKGEIQVTNWNQSNAAKTGWCEGCALREIQQRGSWLAKNKLAQYGVNQKSFITAGHNSHKH